MADIAHPTLNRDDLGPGSRELRVYYSEEGGNTSRISGVVIGLIEADFRLNTEMHNYFVDYRRKKNTAILSFYARQRQNSRSIYPRGIKVVRDDRHNAVRLRGGLEVEGEMDLARDRC